MMMLNALKETEAKQLKAADGWRVATVRGTFRRQT